MTNKFDTLLTTTRVMEIAKANRVKTINWLKNWEVEGQPVGVKRGGRWFAFPDRLIKFLQGNGTRRKNGKESTIPKETSSKTGKKA